MPGPIRRLSAFALTVVLSVGQAAVCAGWLATPEARMACCEQGPCAMHGESGGAPARSLGQADADRCCAASERETPAQETGTGGAAIGLAIVPLPTPHVPSPASTLSGAWEARAPAPVPRIPKYLLLSVLIV